MYNLLFVDDEPLLIDSLQEILPWEKMSINKPYMAYSAEQAKVLFAQHNVDILISDIEMLGCSGFELLSWVKSHYPSTVCAFLTCHANFDFARRAIDLGVCGYLLKPVCADDLQQLLIKCIMHAENTDKNAPLCEQTPHYSKLIASALAYIQQNLGNTISRESISRELFVSESQLSRQFSKEIGMSLPEYITECRFAKAKELLASTDMSITEICTKTGFNYPAYFAQVFRKRTGMTPRQFRENGRSS